MTTNLSQQTCFNCNRSDDDIPVVVWSYQGRPLPVCSACIPLLIHKWELVIATLNQQNSGETNEQHSPTDD